MYICIYIVQINIYIYIYRHIYICSRYIDILEKGGIAIAMLPERMRFVEVS